MESEGIALSTGSAVQVPVHKPAIKLLDDTCQEISQPVAEMPEPRQHNDNSAEVVPLISTEQRAMHIQSM